MNIKEAKEIIVSLGKPSKMPCPSYNTPAKLCVTGRRLRKVKGSTCHKCYAMRGNYVRPNVQRGLHKRFNAFKNKRFVEAMSIMINNYSKKSGYFRWFDSGDLQGLPMLEDINNIAWASPHVKMWLPTKEYNLVKDHSLDIAPNLIIRVSNPNKNKSFKGSFDYVSAVFEKDTLPKDSHICPSYKQGNKCGSCRACWSTKIKEVVYLAH